MSATSPPASPTVAITGGTGYIGRALVPALLAAGCRVRVLVRPGSEKKIPAGVEAMTGDPLDPAAVRALLDGVETLIHLVGVPKPSPAKARQFREIDLGSIRIAADAVASCARRPHLVYLSVAQPAPVMKAYVAVRQEGEARIHSLGLDATCVRPWYVLGPGHRWPLLLIPIYALLRRLPATRAGADRLGLVTLPQMVRTLVRAVATRPAGLRIVEVPEIRRG